MKENEKRENNCNFFLLLQCLRVKNVFFNIPLGEVPLISTFYFYVVRESNVAKIKPDIHSPNTVKQRYLL